MKRGISKLVIHTSAKPGAVPSAVPVLGRWLEVTTTTLFRLRRPDRNRQGGAILAISVQGAGRHYGAIAFEIPVKPGAPFELGDALDHHAHLVIGEHYRSLAEAKRAAEAFAKTWARSRKPAAQCGCTEIRTTEVLSDRCHHVNRRRRPRAA